jgi:hypothetical protein
VTTKTSMTSRKVSLSSAGKVNFGMRSIATTRLISSAWVFLRDGDRLFHTYSTYGRGVDPFLTRSHAAWPPGQWPADGVAAPPRQVLATTTSKKNRRILK